MPSYSSLPVEGLASPMGAKKPIRLQLQLQKKLLVKSFNPILLVFGLSRSIYHVFTLYTVILP